MRLLTVNVNTIPLGKPLPFSLRNVDGTLLAGKGFVVVERETLETMSSHGTVYIDPAESKQYREAMATHIRDLTSSDTTLQQLAESPLSTIEVHNDTRASDFEESQLGFDGPIDWHDVQVRANGLLRDVNSIRFFSRLDRLHRELTLMATRKPDATLFALIHLTASESRYYSATHSMLVCVMCMLAARDVLKWSPATELSMCRAALTMNISMTEMQDQLVNQPFKLSGEQRSQIDSHPQRSVETLQKRGVDDPIWLEAIRRHHQSPSGPLGNRDVAHQIAHLIHRADCFAARLSPRVSRASLAPAQAMQAIYFDESKKVDEAGASLIKAVGVYPPGSFVKLASNEIATVVNRGATSLAPRVAVLVNRQGLPMAEPAIRDTRLTEYRIVSSVNRNSIKVRSDLLRLLASD
ncbi:MAG: phosphohydrolase [Burkholderiaceae bacterium]|jgi:HD-GYP domain-containing protein (c-di-GMP phosphodiesterase class II)|nr:phosphohydrolase [Burkholderiaceae bacterium]